jgi:hypothetical protein
MVWYGSPEYNARLKAAAKRIALDHILHELLIEVAKQHDDPIACLNALQARVHARFKLETETQGHEIHVQAEASHYSDAYFQAARDVVEGKVPADPDAGESQSAA